MIEHLEGRLLCRVAMNGSFVIDPPGEGTGHSTLHMHPLEGVRGLQIAEAKSNGVVNWEVTTTHEWTPGTPGGPRSA